MAPKTSFEPLSPMSFLDRAAAISGDRLALIDGELQLSYSQLRDRARRLAGALVTVAHGQPVATLVQNTHVAVEAHFGVPWAGAPLVAVNTRLSVDEIAYIIEHSRTAVLIHDSEYDDLVAQVMATVSTPPVSIRTGANYEDLLSHALPTVVAVEDENALLSINYTSGTTGRPKGVMYTHRGAYLQALALVGQTRLTPSSVYLWTLPMFHCNGWCYPWAVTAAAAKHVCLPKFEARQAWRHIRETGVTHLGGAPAALSLLAYDAEASPVAGTPVHVATGGAPPSGAILRRMTELGFDVTHGYGLTETYGPAVLCDWLPEWDTYNEDHRIMLKARQGVGNMVSCVPRVIDARGRDVPPDGNTPGEIVFRGNNVMAGYFDDPQATAESCPDGWFRTGDLGVVHPDGYIELRDRKKDIIISGGENIASVEVEQVIADHPAVRDVAVVAMPDEKWGEVPAAFVTLHNGRETTVESIVGHVQSRLARFKAPRVVIFGELPRNSTGKVQKALLRDRLRKCVSSRLRTSRTDNGSAREAAGDACIDTDAREIAPADKRYRQ